MPRKGMRSFLFDCNSWSSSSSSSNSISRYSVSVSPPLPPPLTNHSPPPPQSHRNSFNFVNDSIVEVDQIVDSAEAIITKWNPDSSTYATVTSMFYEDKTEAIDFIKRVNDLQKAMDFLMLLSQSQSQSQLEDYSNSNHNNQLVHAQSLMEIAMKRLQKEFYQILSINRAHLDPESVSTRSRSSLCSPRSSISVDFDDDAATTNTAMDDDDDDDEIRVAADSISEVEHVASIVMGDLTAISRCMISTGYAKECAHIYKLIRKSIVEEGLYRLGIEKLTQSRINKMDWEVLELKIKNWLDAIKVAIKTLFTGERILCDNVFAVSDSIRESCFSHISRDAAMLLFGFPELVAKTKKSPEKMFRVLDMYAAIVGNWPEIESIFSFESTSAIRIQALTSLSKLSELARSIVMDFQLSIQKNSSKSLIAGAGVHSLTLLAMNYLTFLADEYSSVLTDIFADWTPQPHEKSSLDHFLLGKPELDDDSPSPAAASASASTSGSGISMRMGWLILVLLCKLDRKAKSYKDDDVSLSYLFLTNNLQHIISKVRSSSNLQYLLGDEWVMKQEAKVRQFADKYESLAWGRVFASLPENPTAKMSEEEAKHTFRNFNLAFEETHRKQKSRSVPDPKLRDEMKMSIARKLIWFYQEFYRTHKKVDHTETEREGKFKKAYIRFSPEDIRHHILELYFEPSDHWASTSTSSPSSTSSSTLIGRKPCQGLLMLTQPSSSAHTQTPTKII